MSEQQHVRADGTVTFLPHRLNRHPVVVRGLTADELWICCGLSGAAGLLVGAPLSWVFRTIALAPTFVVLGVAFGRVHRRRHPAPPQAWASRHLAVPATAVAHRHAPSADGGLGGRPCADLALRLLDHPQVCCKGGTMSRFKNEITHLQAHIKTLRLGAGALVIVALVMGGGWWSAPRDLTIHVPPDLRSGSTRKWWEVPPESVYAFTFYVFQTLNRWPTNGEEDYARNLHTLSPYLTPSCQAFLRADYDYRRSTGELRQRVRGIYEIPGRGYGDDPTARVRTVSDRDWVVTLDITRRRVLRRRAGQARPGALPRERSRGWTSIPHATRSAWRSTATRARPSASAHRSRRARHAWRPVSASASRRKFPMKHPVLALLGLLAVAAAPRRPGGGDPALGTHAAGGAAEGRPGAHRVHRPERPRGRARGRRRTPARAERGRRGVPARQRADRAHAAAIAGRRHGRADPAGHRGRAAQGRRSRAGAGAHRRGQQHPARYGDQPTVPRPRRAPRTRRVRGRRGAKPRSPSC
jgi:integrating conjugative element protein (TIGR03746 family)/conjugative transfer region protein (TIGR03750 family)